MNRLRRPHNSTEPSFESLVELFYVEDGRNKRPHTVQKKRKPDKKSYLKRIVSTAENEFATENNLPGSKINDPHGQGLGRGIKNQTRAQASKVEQARGMRGDRSGTSVYGAKRIPKEQLERIKEIARRNSIDFQRIQQKGLVGGASIASIIKQNPKISPSTISIFLQGRDHYIVFPKQQNPSFKEFKEKNPSLSIRKAREYYKSFDWETENRLPTHEELFLLHPEKWSFDQYANHFKNENDAANNVGIKIIKSLVEDKISNSSSPGAVSASRLFDYEKAIQPVVDMIENNPSDFLVSFNKDREVVDYLAKEHNDVVDYLKKKNLKKVDLDEAAGMVYEDFLETAGSIDTNSPLSGINYLALMYVFDDVNIFDENGNYLSPKSISQFKMIGRNQADPKIINEIDDAMESVRHWHTEIDASMVEGTMFDVLGFKNRYSDPFSTLYKDPQGKRSFVKRKNDRKKEEPTSKPVLPLVPMKATRLMSKGNDLSSMGVLVNGEIGFRTKDGSVVEIGKGTSNDVIYGSDRHETVRTRLSLRGFISGINKKRTFTNTPTDGRVRLEIWDSYTGKKREFVNLNPMNHHGRSDPVRKDPDTNKVIPDRGIFASRWAEVGGAKKIMTVDDIEKSTGVHPFQGLYNLWKNGKQDVNLNQNETPLEIVDPLIRWHEHNDDFIDKQIHARRWGKPARTRRKERNIREGNRIKEEYDKFKQNDDD